MTTLGNAQLAQMVVESGVGAKRCYSEGFDLLLMRQALVDADVSERRIRLSLYSKVQTSSYVSEASYRRTIFGSLQEKVDETRHRYAADKDVVDTLAKLEVTVGAIN